MFSNQSDSYKSFKKDYRVTQFSIARKLAIFAASLYMLFAILDSILAPSFVRQIIQIRAVFILVIFSIIGLTYVKFFKQHWQKLYSLLVIIAGIGIIVMSSYLKTNIRTLYLQELLLIIFYGYGMNRLMLLPATIAGLSITTIFTISIFNTPGIEQMEIVTSIFLQIAANIFGILSVAYNQRLHFLKYKLNQNNIKHTENMAELNKKLLSLNKRLNNLASTDGLTGIANRRYFDKYLDRFVRISQHDKKPLSLIMLDIDYFKLYNDYYGHVKGDDCLKIIAQILQSSIKEDQGIVARFGGEEFTVLLPNTDFKKAVIIVEQIIADLKDKEIENHDSTISPYVTASYGIVTACIEYQSLTAKKLVTYADTCLYEAKEHGRNKYIAISI